jgi:cytochrome b561
MAVREIVAWVMVALFGAAGGYCLMAILKVGLGAPPETAAVAAAGFTLTGVVVLEIALGIFFPQQSGAPPDERERLIVARAGHWAGLGFLVGVLPALGHYVVHGDGNVMFHVIVLSLMASGLIEYGAQIVLFRR